jgi:hypothetical protein
MAPDGFFWRPAWNPDWTHEQRVSAEELTLPGVSIDDFVFGVAALDGAGNESLVAAYVAPVRPAPEIKLVP